MVSILAEKKNYPEKLFHTDLKRGEKIIRKEKCNLKIKCFQESRDRAETREANWVINVGQLIRLRTLRARYFHCKCWIKARKHTVFQKNTRKV